MGATMEHFPIAETSQDCGGQHQRFGRMIIEVWIILKQVVESVICRQRRVCGEIILIDKTHDVAIDIAVLVAGEIAVIDAILSILGVGATEGDLVANIVEGDGCARVGLPTVAVIHIIIQLIQHEIMRLFRKRYRGASRYCLKGEGRGERIVIHRPAKGDAAGTSRPTRHRWVFVERARRGHAVKPFLGAIRCRYTSSEAGDFVQVRAAVKHFPITLQSQRRGRQCGCCG